MKTMAIGTGFTERYLMREEMRQIVADLVQAGRQDAVCCPGELVTRRWRLGPNGLRGPGVATKAGRLTLKTIAGSLIRSCSEGQLILSRNASIQGASSRSDADRSELKIDAMEEVRFVAREARWHFPEPCHTESTPAAAAQLGRGPDGDAKSG